MSSIHRLIPQLGLSLALSVFSICGHSEGYEPAVPAAEAPLLTDGYIREKWDGDQRLWHAQHRAFLRARHRTEQWQGSGYEPAVPAAEAQGTRSTAIRIAYGSDPLQFGDLRLPSGPGPYPVAVVIHGGCWSNMYGGLEWMDAMSDTLAAAGVATWNIEYRRLGDPGGGFPNTLTDVGLAVDTVRELAATYHLDLGRVITVGWSAGGHLALWSAARHRLPAGNPLRGADPLPLSSVVSLAGVPNLAESLDLDVCWDLAEQFLEGTPDQVPERYAETSPSEFVPLGLRQTLIHGTADQIVPLEMSEHYRDTARDAGDHQVSLKKVHGADHFDMINPTSSKWPQVFERIIEQFE